MNTNRHEADNRSRHILLSSMGISKRDDPTTYVKDGKTADSCFSSFGILQLLPEDERPNELWFLLTPEAKSTKWADIQKEARTHNVTVHPVDIPDTGSPDDTRDFLEITAKEIPAGCQLTLNVTEGLRHQAFLFYALALYLSQFRDIEIKGAWYCRRETPNRIDPKPVIDLKPVLDLANWFHAVAVFKDYGSTQPFAELTQSLAVQLKAKAEAGGNDQEFHRQAGQMKALTNALGDYSFNNNVALPLELGKTSCSLAQLVGQFSQSQLQNQLPLAEELGDQIGTEASRFAFPHRPPSKGKWKESITLDIDELARQAAMIDQYLNREQLPQAMGLMREWVISWLMFRDRCTDGWLLYRNRKPFEQRLGALSALAQHGNDALRNTLTKEQAEFAGFWHRLSNDLRNAMHHHGLRVEEVESPPVGLKEVRQYWARLKTSFVDLSIGGVKGCLMICPIGNTPGVLYTALCLAKPVPSRLLVICSKQSESFIDEAIKRAGIAVELKKLRLNDPYCGMDEFPSLVSDAQEWTFDAENILAGLTGGTTLMGVLIAKLVSAAERQSRVVRRFALIDPRSPEEQRNDPWKIGKWYDVDEPPDDE